jgi:predicted nuclease with RNAse H fold
MKKFYEEEPNCKEDRESCTRYQVVAVDHPLSSHPAGTLKKESSSALNFNRCNYGSTSKVRLNTNSF